MLALVALGGAALWYLTAPPKGADGYRERAASSAETVHSQVQVARIWVESLEDDQSTEAATLVGLEETERDAQRAVSRFEGYEPPTGLVDLRAEFSSLADETTGVLAALRIAAQQEEWSGLPEIAEALPPLAERLKDLEERAEP